MLLISWFPLSVRTSVPTNYRYGKYQAVLSCIEHSDWCTTHTSSLSNWYVLLVPSDIPWYDELDWFIIGCLLGRYSMFQFFLKKNWRISSLWEIKVSTISLTMVNISIPLLRFVNLFLSLNMWFFAFYCYV